MFKKTLAASALALTAMLAAPALAFGPGGPDGGTNQSLNSFVGSATAQQVQQVTRFRTAPGSTQAAAQYSSGADNPSLESYSGESVATSDSDTRFETAPQTAENPDYSWIGDVKGGA